MTFRESLLLVTFTCVVIVVLTTCGGVSNRADDSTFIDPCMPLDGSKVDPCNRDPLWKMESSHSASYTADAIPALPIDLFNEMISEAESSSPGLNTPQFYVRGTFVPGSARCSRATMLMKAAEHEFRLRPALPVFSGRAVRDGFAWFNCFVDLKVNEYFNGNGPGTIPIQVYWGGAGDDPSGPSHSAFLRGWPGTSLEGKEMVVVLTRPVDISVASWSWNRNASWDVQRRPDGEVVVVSLWAGVLGVADPSKWEYTLKKFRPMVIDAMARFKAHTGGRIGYHQDDPDFAKDANGASLIEHLRDLGAFTVNDITPAPAPTVPGETDPDPYGYSVSEDTQTASPEVPGGLEGTATPVSSLGDEPTATATVEPTATEEAEPTATATVDPTVTPEAAPTPEPEDTPTSEAEHTATATPEPVVDPTDTPTPDPEPTATDTPEPVVEPTATPTPEPAIEPTATPEDAVATDTPEPEVPAPEGPGAVGGEGPGEGGPDGSDTGTGPDG